MFKNSLKALSNMLLKKEISSVELTKLFLERIQTYNSQLNVFITITKAHALKQAKQADKKIQKGSAHVLTGIPIAHKDIFCTKDIKTSCGSKMLDNFIAPYESTVSQKFKDIGMVLLGKTNMDEFAMGSSNETSFYGAVKNPWNVSYVPGGSSGGSAAAVAARLTPCATGTDTGGSIRQPAAYCGITGIKPTYGRVSRFGMIAFASSLDQGGPMAKNAEDCALLLEVMAGFDPKDSTSANQAVEHYSQSINQDIKGIKIGFPKEFLNDSISSEIKTNIEQNLKILRKMGAKIITVELPNMHLSIPAYYIIAPAECSSNLARYDGIRFGYRCKNPKNIEALYKRTRAEGFGSEVKQRILVGTCVLSAGYYDTYYLKAQKVRQIITNDFKEAFKKVDVIIGPTAPGTAFKLNEKINDPINMYLNDIYTSSVNLAGLPALSIPSGFYQGLPLGLQLIGQQFDESNILRIAHWYQKETKWHEQMPEEFV